MAAIYADAPVCDVASWPGGRGKGTGSPEDWLRLLDVYGATEQEALSGKLSPVNRLAPLANARIPVLAVVVHHQRRPGGYLHHLRDDG